MLKLFLLINSEVKGIASCESVKSLRYLPNMIKYITSTYSNILLSHHDNNIILIYVMCAKGNVSFKK